MHNPARHPAFTFTSPRAALALILAALITSASAASASPTRDDDDRGNRNSGASHGQPRRASPPPATHIPPARRIGNSHQPGRITGGGVKMRFPDPLGNRGSLLNRRSSRSPFPDFHHDHRHDNHRGHDRDRSDRNRHNDAFIEPWLRHDQLHDHSNNRDHFQTLHRDHRNTWTSGSSLTVNGRYSSDNFRLAFHLGGVSYLTDPHHNYTYLRHRYPGYCFQSYPITSYYNSPFLYAYDNGYRYDPAYYPSVVYGPAYTPAAPAPQPQPAPQTPAVEPTTLERAEAALAFGYPKEAVLALREHLRDHPTDSRATRLLAMALFEDRRVEEAVAVNAMAYENDPTLAWQRIHPDTFTTDRSLRARVESAVVYANRVKTASAWLFVVTLMQAEGRDAVAAKMLDRAKQLGLKPAVADELALSLGK